MRRSIPASGSARSSRIRSGSTTPGTAAPVPESSFATPLEATLSWFAAVNAKDKAAERVDQLKQVRVQLGAVTQAAH